MILSNNKYLLDSNFDPLDQLRLLKEKCNNISSHLYKVNYLYLEEVRNFLPQAIRTSLLSLITDNPGNGFGFSTLTSRKRFQLEVDKLVSDNISFLTIEYLNELAKKIDEENIRHISNAKDEIEDAINLKNNSEKSESSNGFYSVNISAVPPLENLSIIEGWNGELKAPYSIDNKDSYTKSSMSERECDVANNYKEDHLLKEENKNFDNYNLKSNDIELLQSIFSMNEDSNLTDLESEKDESPKKNKSDEDAKKKRLLPQSPIDLYEWMLSIDVALVRRLRDLSHAINNELLKSGLVNTLVPINILDAALVGQLTSSKSISNILSLKLPTNSSLDSGGLDIDCLLITPSDMEFDNARLRKNRTHIKYYQNILLDMIKQQRYWQGRSIAEEVNKEWWKDTTKI